MTCWGRGGYKNHKLQIFGVEFSQRLTYRSFKSAPIGTLIQFQEQLITFLIKIVKLR